MIFITIFFRNINNPRYTVFYRDGFTIIKTKAENIKPETIRHPICSDYIKDLEYYGVNAGFFNTVYRENPKDENFFSVSVSWSKDDEINGLETCKYNIRDPEEVALGKGKYISRGILFLYKYNDEFFAHIISAESVDDVAEKMKIKRGMDYDYHYMISGGNFYIKEYPNMDDWGKWIEEKYKQEGPIVMENAKTGRTGIGIKKEKGIWYTYIAVSSIGENTNNNGKTLQELRDLFIGLGCSDAIFLDGAGSSQMRIIDNKNKLIEHKGDNRYIWSMVRVLDR